MADKPRKKKGPQAEKRKKKPRQPKTTEHKRPGNEPAAPAATQAVSGADAAASAEARAAEPSVPAELPIVAIGASAGGLDAFKQFLAATPPDSGIAFILIPHLDPRHHSLMPELLGKQTSMPVEEARHGVTIEPNHVYIIPPNKYLAVRGGRLILSPPPKPHWTQTALDFGLRSLADAQQHRAIGIVLSGTGAHGTLGIKEIKLAGGMVMAQTPETAEYDQMPRNAIATGLTDYVLPPNEMPATLIDYVRHAFASGGRERTAEIHSGDLTRILALLRARTKYDFRHYRKNMITRRVHRRMSIMQIDSMAAYLKRLRDDKTEMTALCKDLLIGVTSFFREPEAFEVLAKRVLPELVAAADAETPVRVWVPGCATGEEAYSIAILLTEEFQRAKKVPRIQIFATDIDDDSLDKARQGLYTDNMIGALSEERLRRFFTKVDEHHYRVEKSLREAVVFAPQNLITDAPFSRLHLISCRNVLIYLEPDVQTKVISLLHFALLEGAYLLLGPSESIGRAVDMFEPVSKRWHVFRRIGPARRDLVNIPIVATAERPRMPVPAEGPRAPAPDLTQAMQRLLSETFAPAACLINRKYEILSVQGPLVDYLEFPPGEISKDLLLMARQGLRTKLHAACHKALREKRAVIEPHARVKRDDNFTACSITVRPLTEPKEVEGLLLVVFEDRTDAPPSTEDSRAAAPARDGEDNALIEQLEDELRATREDLQSTIEELESSNEELKASNEEIMSMNEELQSANEELETSKEELQSLNEELATVNSQLREKVEDLDHEGNDMANLMAATDIPTVFLDTRLNIKRFTPATRHLLTLLASDIGRPFRNFAPKFKDDTLLADAETVLQDLQPREKEVFSDEGRWYLRRIMPYRMTDNRIGGIVLTFVDITLRIEAEALARRLANVLLESNDAVTVRDFSGRITAWNRGAERLYGYTEAEALKLNIHDIADEAYCSNTADLAQRSAAGEYIESFEAERRTRDGRSVRVWVTVTPVRDNDGEAVAVSTIEKDITARHRAEEEVRHLNATLERRVAERAATAQAGEHRIRAVLDAAVDAIVTIDANGRVETFNQAAERMFGYAAQEVIGQNVRRLMPDPYRREHDAYLRRYRETGEARIIGKPRELKGLRKDGTVFPIELSVSRVENLDLFTGMVRDLTTEKSLQQEILQIATLEQRRIGQELHDVTQQELSGLGLLAANLADALRSKDAPEHELAERLADGIATANSGVRSLAKGLLPGDVQAESLAPALAELAETVRRHDGIDCRFEGADSADVGNDIAAMHLYRIAQEAVNNAVKHAKADKIEIRLRGRDGAIGLEIRDDGVGIDEPTEISRRGLGLRTMTHRCSLIGGELSIEKLESGGTRIVCTAPQPLAQDVPPPDTTETPPNGGEQPGGSE